MKENNNELNSQQVFELEKDRLKIQSWAFGGVLFVVAVLNIAPLLASSVRRPPDNILNKMGENSLILTTSLATGFSLLMGYTLGSQGQSTSRNVAYGDFKDVNINKKETDDKKESSSILAPEEGINEERNEEIDKQVH